MQNNSPPKLSFDFPEPKTLRLKLSGDWKITNDLPKADEIFSQPATRADFENISFDVPESLKWDSGLIIFLLQLSRACKRKNIRMAKEGLPLNVRSFFGASTSAMTGTIKPCKVQSESFFEMIGSRFLRINAGMCSLFAFLGEIVLACGRLVSGKSTFRRDEFYYLLKTCGIDALFLVSLISLMVGIIFAFVGAIQLTMFGAQIYIANIVGVAMVRVMGAVMAGILMAGRTGASFAAELGIMQTNEEIDALKTLGVNPVDFLVIPRMLALIIMLPLLTLYADMLGILGGMAICAGVFDINPLEYWQNTLEAVKLNDLWVGLVNSFVFGVIIAIAGCYYGIKCERNAAGVGTATTSAVVSAITGIVIATAVITFICQILGV